MDTFFLIGNNLRTKHQKLKEEFHMPNISFSALLIVCNTPINFLYNSINSCCLNFFLYPFSFL